MTIFKKFLAMFLTAVMAVTAIPGTAAAQPDILYQTSSQQTITAGATLEHISRFTADGWLNIKVLRIDTTNPNIKVDTLANPQTTDKLSTVLSLAAKNEAVAAVNASFFNPLAQGKGYPDGPIVRTGDLLSTSAWYNKNKGEMASFSLSDSGQILFDFWRNDLTLTVPGQALFTVNQYNQPSRKQYNDITVLDGKWGVSTLGASDTYPDLVEILVSQGQVTAVRQGLPPTGMPENGYVVVSRGEQAAKLLESIRLGNPLQFTITSNPDWSAMQMAVTGSSILVQNGRIPEAFSYSVGSFNKKNPRTIVGSSQDGKQLIMVTVDGRQDNSVGLTQTESAELMLELGAYNALILDGGGSTTMVARQPGTADLEVVNHPSEGSLRGVATAIGVFSQSSPASLAKLILESEDPNFFINTSRKFILKGMDRNANPVEIRPEQVQWSVSGIKGSFTGNVFHPTSAGNGKITAKVGELAAEMDVRSLKPPVKLALSTGALEIQPGQSQSLEVTGYDNQGFPARIQPEDVRWKVSGQIGDCQKGIFKASTIGTGYLEAAVGQAYAYCAVSVYRDLTKTIHSFEEEQAVDENQAVVFQANPQIAQGSLQMSAEQVHGGNTAAQLMYDYFDSRYQGEVSLAFPGKGLELPAGTSRLAVWLYNTQENDNRILGEVVDSAGKKHQVEFTANLRWTGWKKIEASLEKIKLPGYLSRLYVQNADPAAGWGKIYLDDLSAKISQYPAPAQSKKPENTVPRDEANRKATFTPGRDNFRFSVFGSSREPQNSLEKQLLKKLTGYINEKMDLAVYAGNKASSAAKGLKKPALLTENVYKTYNLKNSTFIQLDISKGGLRRSDPKQWTWFFKELENAPGKNAFIIMSGDPAAFINAKEAQLLKDTLAGYREKTGKNVWVLYQGALNQSQLDRGVRYLSCAGFSTPDFSPGKPNAAKYLQVTVQGNDLSFEFRSI